MCSTADHTKSPDNTGLNAVLDRVRSIIKKRLDSAVADALGVSRSAIPTWRKRGTMPVVAVVDFGIRNNISLDWLFRGIGKPELPTWLVQQTHSTQDRFAAYYAAIGRIQDATFDSPITSALSDQQMTCFISLVADAGMSNAQIVSLIPKINSGEIRFSPEPQPGGFMEQTNPPSPGVNRENEMTDIHRIHALTDAIARMTKGGADIHAVAEQYIEGALIPEGETPVDHLQHLRADLDAFLDDLTGAVKDVDYDDRRRTK